MKSLASLSFLIPCYNDQTTIKTVVLEAVRIARRLAIPFEIIVINDASRDKTGQILSGLTKRIRKLRIITHTTNKGYGATIKELYYAGKNTWLFTIPGDYQIGAKELLKLIPMADTSDMVVGLRTKRSDSRARKRQSKVYNSLLQLFFRMPVQDANSVRLMKRQIMEKITLSSSSAFVDAELVLRAQGAGYRICQSQIVHRQRANGTHGGGGRLKTILPTIKDMVIFFVKHI